MTKDIKNRPKARRNKHYNKGRENHDVSSHVKSFFIILVYLPDDVTVFHSISVDTLLDLSIIPVTLLEFLGQNITNE